MTAEAAAWPWRVALETLGHDAAAAPPHTLAKLIEGEKLPWVVARVEKALRREDDAADAVFVLGDASGATMGAPLSPRARAPAAHDLSSHTSCRTTSTLNISLRGVGCTSWPCAPKRPRWRRVEKRARAARLAVPI